MHFCCEVDARWLLDLHNFNEWVNEEDYLIDEVGGYVNIVNSNLL